jgi:hypothetical protein
MSFLGTIGFAGNHQSADAKAQIERFVDVRCGFQNHVPAANAYIGHSVFNGHPRFMGYITSSAAPLGSLAELLAATVNPNCGSWGLSPMATLIEAQTVSWIAELVGCPRDSGGLLVSGGNMANMVGFWAARASKAGWDLRAGGIDTPGASRLVAYCSAETHTWIQKAADLFGFGQFQPGQPGHVTNLFPADLFRHDLSPVLRKSLFRPVQLLSPS